MPTKGQPKKRDAVKDTAARNWITVLYPESLRDDFRDIIQEWHVPALLSPLHDRDKEKDGSPKKPHYHLLVMYQGNHRYSQMCELFGGLVKAGRAEPKVCQDMRGSARYWCHLDNPEKAQYAPSDVTAFSGANYQEMIELPTDKERYIREMCAWCRAEGCISFAALVDEAATNHPDWHHALVSNCTMIMFRYVRSLEDEMSKGQYRKPKPEADEDAPKLSPLEEAKARVREYEQRLAEARYAVDTLSKGDEEGV